MQIIFYGMLLLTSMLWAGNFVAGKFLVDHSSPMMLTVMRWVIAILVLIPIVWVRERKILPPAKAIFSLFLMGLTGVVLFNFFMFMALERTSAGNVGLLSALNPVSIALASFFLLREKINVRQIAGMMISLFGVIVVISQGHLQRIIELKFNTGDMFMLLAVLCWGLYSVAGRKAMKFVSPYMSTLWSGIFGILTIIPFNLSKMTITQPNFSFWMATLYAGIGATVVAMVLWNIGVQRVGGTKSGIFLNFNPIFTAILSYVILREYISFPQIIGTILVIGGVYLFTSKKRVMKKIQPGPAVPRSS
ncbi:DMT family transporter [Aneurinibacillus terranovensis]|uniref:DMT family transporter n=1 Tax=Aneurinibacillus terranovensis TaxID=278991 RepID=UPI00042596E2|nr:DMT family transporter [Aneurinibacillus terranovensis]